MLPGAIDLRAVKNEHSMAVATEVNAGMIMVDNGMGGKSPLPVLELKFQMLNGEVRKGVNIPPQMVIPMINILSGWLATIQGAAPPVPPAQTAPDGATNGPAPDTRDNRIVDPPDAPLTATHRFAPDTGSNKDEKHS